MFIAPRINLATCGPGASARFVQPGQQVAKRLDQGHHLFLDHPPPAARALTETCRTAARLPEPHRSMPCRSPVSRPPQAQAVLTQTRVALGDLPLDRLRPRADGALALSWAASGSRTVTGAPMLNFPPPIKLEKGWSPRR